MAVLVTGAAGFIGSHLCDRLLAEGRRVVGLDSFDPYYSRAIKEANLAAALDHGAFRLVEGDIRDADLLRTLPEVDSIVHLAARAGVRPSIREPALYADVNVTGTVRMLELAAERGIESFVFGSSSSVYGNNERVPFSETDPVDHPISPYAASKRAAELLCHTAHHLHGTRVLCLRFFTVYGPRQRPDLAIHAFARRLAEGKPLPVFGDGSSARDYTYFTDILDGIVSSLRVLEEGSVGFDIVNLGESRTVTLDEMVRVIGEEMGVEPEIERLPPQPGDVRRTWADVTHAQELLGYRPSVDFRQGVRSFVAWFREAWAAGSV